MSMATSEKITETAGEEQLVVFRLDGEYFGVEIGRVREIIAWQPVTRIPRAPCEMEGVINLRGGVIPVVDLRKCLGLRAGEVGSETRIVVVEMGTRAIGMIVDAVTEVLRLERWQVEPPTGATVAGVEASFLRGVGKVGDRLIILLDVDQILDPETSGSILLAGCAGER